MRGSWSGRLLYPVSGCVEWRVGAAAGRRTGLGQRQAPTSVGASRWPRWRRTRQRRRPLSRAMAVGCVVQPGALEPAERGRHPGGPAVGPSIAAAGMRRLPTFAFPAPSHTMDGKRRPQVTRHHGRPALLCRGVCACVCACMCVPSVGSEWRGECTHDGAGLQGGSSLGIDQVREALRAGLVVVFGASRDSGPAGGCVSTTARRGLVVVSALAVRRAGTSEGIDGQVGGRADWRCGVF